MADNQAEPEGEDSGSRLGDFHRRHNIEVNERAAALSRRTADPLRRSGGVLSHASSLTGLPAGHAVPGRDE